MEMLYFGCWDGQSGHVLCDTSGNLLRDLKLPRALQLGRLDGGYCSQTCSQAQGLALVHHIDGWTVLAMWDRTMDKRPNSNSAFITEGTYSFKEMMHGAEVTFPILWKRINSAGAVQQGGLLVDNKVTGLPEAVLAWMGENDGWSLEELELDSSLWTKVGKLPVESNTLRAFVGVPINRNVHLSRGMMRATFTKTPSHEEVVHLVNLFEKLKTI